MLFNSVFESLINLKYFVHLIIFYKGMQKECISNNAIDFKLFVQEKHMFPFMTPHIH